MRNSRAASVQLSISTSSSLVYASAVMYTKTYTSGGQISSNFEAINMAATLTSCNYLRGTGRRTRYGQSDTHVVRCDVDQPIDHPLCTFGRHHGPKPWRARPMPEGPERRLTIQCATYRTQCSRADRRQRKPLQHTTSIPSGLCCNLPKQEGSRTSQKCYRSPSIQSTCPNPEESIPIVALQAARATKIRVSAIPTQVHPEGLPGTILKHRILCLPLAPEVVQRPPYPETEATEVRGLTDLGRKAEDATEVTAT